MATAVIMPKQGQSVETCIITKWFKSKGESVSAGDILFSYETDKAAFDMEAQSDGVLLEIFYPEGSEVPVLAEVAVLGMPGEAVTAPAAPVTVTTTESTAPAETAAVTKTVAQVQPEPAGIQTDEKTRISPRAKKMAEARGINYSALRGTGPNGRIIAADIEAFTPGATTVAPQLTGAEYADQPLSNVRRLIAKAMHASLQNSAQLTHHMSADVRKLLDARQKVKENIAAGLKQQDITLNDMICLCVVRALGKFPEANSHFLDDRIRTFSRVHLGFAVDTPRGLMVPVVKNADTMDLVALSAALKSAADSCKKGNINPELIQSTAASFTVSNLGNYGVELFTPVINLPQAGILGVCTIINRPVSLGSNAFGFVPYIGLSLTYDHRAIDGGPATLFLKEIRDQIEKFSLQ